MTENDAKTKVCPFVSEKNSFPFRCVASECMAWRFDVKYVPTKAGPIPRGYKSTGRCGLVKP